MNSLLENLNKEQRAAVAAVAAGGPVLILAGAGTGKTTTLIAAIATQVPVHTHNILAVTFTNKAAGEMKNRIFEKKGERPYWCGTFHSVCLKILRREKQAMGLRHDFLVFGEDEQKKLLKSVFKDLNLDPNDYDPATWIDAISFYKDTGKKNNNGKFGIILDAYNGELARLNAVDFADIINHTNNLLIDNPNVLEKYQQLFKYIFVDEFQDTNAPQYTLLRLLSARHGNICCVGDDDQSIYSWRGAQIGNILNFEKDFPNAKIFRLTQNYRSTGHILNAANSLIKRNRGRLGKDLWSSLGDGHKVKVVSFYSDLEEANAIANAIENSPAQKKSDFAILIRNGSLSKKFEDEFIARQIPYKLVGAQKFYDRQEIQDVIAYLRLLVYRFDDLSFLRIIARPRRGLGEQTINELKSHAMQAGKSLFDSLKEIKLKPKQRIGADEFIRAFDFEPLEMQPTDAALQLLENSGYLKMWKESKDDNAEDRIKNIYELINGTISRYDTLVEFLENASLMIADDGPVDNMDTGADGVLIMTIHAAKGLEFENVFLPAWEEGIFPNVQKSGDDIEEERRLAYVALTRAKRNCIISNAMSRMLFGGWQNNPPSRFIGEIADEHKDTGEKENAPRRPLNNFSSSFNKKPSMVGKLVNHDELGSGVVIEDSGDILTIAFKGKGIKKVGKKFVR
jgi:DNA helicase-2/ATP-dependent DNA helicase PcrA